MEDRPVWREGVWHNAHPTELNFALPFEMDAVVTLPKDVTGAAELEIA